MKLLHNAAEKRQCKKHGSVLNYVLTMLIVYLLCFLRQVGLVYDLELGRLKPSCARIGGDRSPHMLPIDMHTYV